ncbi:MAG: poly(A) polymerase, partial [Planctomycetes bacterium]|nr:poly(A) polymerase [Planctomycetota bacterium]
MRRAAPVRAARLAARSKAPFPAPLLRSPRRAATVVSAKAHQDPQIPRKTAIQPKKISPSGLDCTQLDPDAVRSIQRLDARGYPAYLVGGCVRDLLLDREPKDFDIATEARPQQVKRAFPRNCRIIGRRFKLAHLHF